MPALLKTTQIQEPSSASVNLTLDANGNGTFAGTAVMSSPYTMRNKIINGAMVIDQRNAGASVTISANAAQYITDRFIVRGTQASKLTAQQNAGSVTLPSGFINYLGCTSSSAFSVASSDYFVVEQRIEGFNIADLGWGTANAQTVTLSFRVYSSLTGTFSGSISNSSLSRSYPFSYTISSANTWTSVSVTILGDTTGTWLTTNGIGLSVFWNLGSGSTYLGTAGSWSSNVYLGSTGSQSVVGTNGATFYITGVQLERGTVATPFEYRNYQQELAMCQRYYFKTFSQGTAPGTATYIGSRRHVSAGNGFRLDGSVQFPVAMRTNPSVVVYSPVTGASGYCRNEDTNVETTIAVYYPSETNASVMDVPQTTGNASYALQMTASAEL